LLKSPVLNPADFSIWAENLKDIEIGSNIDTLNAQSHFLTGQAITAEFKLDLVTHDRPCIYVCV
jgi:hypothetical protein